VISGSISPVDLVLVVLVDAGVDLIVIIFLYHFADKGSSYPFHVFVDYFDFPVCVLFSQHLHQPNKQVFLRDFQCWFPLGHDGGVHAFVAALHFEYFFVRIVFREEGHHCVHGTHTVAPLSGMFFRLIRF